ncbi:hypothetical protein [Streptomyces kaempferi]|uniref:Uncharacterized protein n=1 Tax=Streptomyces kaempferi TaxID=333725 RepID=A0ABW3XKE2_9ACTN
MRRRHPNNLIRNLLIGSLIILAAMHPDGTRHLAQLAAGLLLAIIQGIADAATAHPGPAILTAGLIWIAHQARTHRPHAAARH